MPTYAVPVLLSGESTKLESDRSSGEDAKEGNNSSSAFSQVVGLAATATQ